MILFALDGSGGWGGSKEVSQRHRKKDLGVSCELEPGLKDTVVGVRHSPWYRDLEVSRKGRLHVSLLWIPLCIEKCFKTCETQEHEVA